MPKTRKSSEKKKERDKLRMRLKRTDQRFLADQKNWMRKRRKEEKIRIQLLKDEP